MGSKQVLSGKDLRAARLRSHLTQYHLADRAVVHVQTVRYWERKAEVKGYAPERMLMALEIKSVRPQPREALAAQTAAAAVTTCRAKTRSGTPCKPPRAKLSEPMWTLFFELHTGPVAQAAIRGLTHDR